MVNDINRRSCIDYIEVHIVDHDSSMGTHNMLVHKDSHTDQHCSTYCNRNFFRFLQTKFPRYLTSSDCMLQHKSLHSLYHMYWVDRHKQL